MTTLHADVLPKDGENGWFGDRETVLRPCDCGCGRPTSNFAGTNDWCEEQTMELRGDDPGMSLSDMQVLAMLMDDDFGLEALLGGQPSPRPSGLGGLLGGLGLGELLGGLLGGGRRQRQTSFGQPLVVQQRPGETEHEAVMRGLSEMLGGGWQFDADDPFSFLRELDEQPPTGENDDN